MCYKFANLGADSGGVVFVTAFSGLFAPYWIDDCRGTICMLNTQERYHSRSLHTKLYQSELHNSQEKNI